MYWGERKEAKPLSTYKERRAHDRINVVEVRETPEPQEPRRIKRMHAEVVQKEAPPSVRGNNSQN